MKIIAAYLLAVLGGNAAPPAADIKSILNSVGAEAEDGMVNLLLSQVEGKDIAELIASGREKMASIAGGGGAAVPPMGGGAAVAAAGGSVDAEDAKEEKKKEEVVEESDEEDFALDLFG